MAEYQQTQRRDHHQEAAVTSLKLKIKMRKPEEQDLDKTVVEEKEQKANVPSLKLKIKMRRPEEQNLNVSSLKVKMAEEEEEASLKVKMAHDLRACSECGKQFTSGRALGGHRKACLQSKTKIKNLHLKNKNKNWTCYVCGQYFMSVKSLYDHMRQHREREWRGIQASSSSNNSASHHVNLLYSLKGWSLKAKRSQRFVNDHHHQERDHDHVIDNKDASMEEAANGLLLLALSRLPSQSPRGYGLLKRKRSDIDYDSEHIYDDGESDHGMELMKKKRILITGLKDDDEKPNLHLNLGLGKSACEVTDHLITPPWQQKKNSVVDFDLNERPPEYYQAAH